jgi:urease accessory protein
MGTSTEKLARLLQLASPALPVGAYSYSGGLEAAIEAGIVHDAVTAQRWIEDVLAHSVSRMEAPVLARMLREPQKLSYWNEMFLASRETAELRAETVQMGYSLTRLLTDLGVDPPDLDEPSYPAAYACAALAWNVEQKAALVAYLWAWAENQAMAALKAVPLGQTQVQKLLLALGDRLETLAGEAMALDDDSLGNFTPGLAMLSSIHETQYSRLFRS